MRTFTPPHASAEAGLMGLFHGDGRAAHRTKLEPHEPEP
jgi:hypothetical protein